MPLPPPPPPPPVDVDPMYVPISDNTTIIAYISTANVAQSQAQEPKMPCPPLPTPFNGTVLVSEMKEIGTFKATFTCNRGFNLIGDSELLCEMEGKWSNRPPTCQSKRNNNTLVLTSYL